MKSKFTPEFWVLFIGLILTGFGMLGGTVAWGLSYFAANSRVDAVEKAIAVEREERHELKAEIDTLYKTQVPPEERQPLAHPHKIGEE